MGVVSTIPVVASYGSRLIYLLIGAPVFNYFLSTQVFLFFCYIMYMYKRLTELLSILFIIVLFFLIIQYSPTSIGPTGLLFIFLLIYLILSVAISELIYYSSRAVSYYSSRLSKRSRNIITFRQSYYYGSIISMAPVILIALSSIGSIGLYEVILTIVFVVLGCFFVSKR